MLTLRFILEHWLMAAACFAPCIALMALRPRAIPGIVLGVLAAMLAFEVAHFGALGAFVRHRPFASDAEVLFGAFVVPAAIALAAGLAVGIPLYRAFKHPDDKRRAARVRGSASSKYHSSDQAIHEATPGRREDGS